MVSSVLMVVWLFMVIVDVVNSTCLSEDSTPSDVSRVRRRRRRLLGFPLIKHITNNISL